MAQKKRWGIAFKGVDKYLEQLKKVDGAAQKAVDRALVASQALVADKAASAMQPHNKTHVTADQILRDGQVVWTGETAEIGVGFKISSGDGELAGLPSIFIMYGTTEDNQVKYEGDENLFSAVYGSDTRSEVRKLQKAEFDKALREVMK